MAARIMAKSPVIVFLIICLVFLLQEVQARPPWLSPNSKVFNESSDCHTNDELLDLCQRCAKLTKANDAYRHCCSTNDVQARRWCSDYVYFGRGQYDFY